MVEEGAVPLLVNMMQVGAGVLAWSCLRLILAAGRLPCHFKCHLLLPEAHADLWCALMCCEQHA